jgi:excisionase family DNA binding protein
MTPALVSDVTISAAGSPVLTAFCDAISCDIRTACKLSGISRSYLYEVLARGDVRSVKAGRKRLVLVDSLRAWLHALPTEGLTSPTQSDKDRSESIRVKVPAWKGSHQ